MKKCPFCAEEIQDEAITCNYCGEMLEKSSPRPAVEEPAPGRVTMIPAGILMPGERVYLEARSSFQSVSGWWAAVFLIGIVPPFDPKISL